MDRDPRYKLSTSQSTKEWRPDDKKPQWQPPREQESYEPDINPADFLANKPEPQEVKQQIVQAGPKATKPEENNKAADSLDRTVQSQESEKMPKTLAEGAGSEKPQTEELGQKPKPPITGGKKSHKAIIIAAIIFGLFLLGIVAILILRWFQTPVNTQQSVLDSMLGNGLETTSFKEDTIISQSGEESTITRAVRFKEPGVMTVYISGLRKTGTNDTFEIIVDDRDAFIRPNISTQTLSSASKAQKDIYDNIQNQWVQIVKDAQPIASKEATLINAREIFKNQRILLPEVFIIGLFNVNQKDQLIGEVNEDNIYTPTSSEPARDIINSIETWRFNVSIDTEDAKSLNSLAASMIDEDFYGDIALDANFPQTVELWASRVTSELLQYKYTLNNQNITIRYSNINQDVEIPLVNNPISPANIDEQVKDEVQKDKLQAIANTLTEKRSQGIAFPPDDTSFKDFVRMQLPADQKEGLVLEFSNGNPGKYAIFYQPKSACGDDGGLVKNDNANTFSLRTTLATAGEFCLDNQE